MLLNTENLKTLFEGFKATFNKGWQSAPSQYKRVAMTVPSSTREETYGWLNQFPKMREWVGDRVIHNLSASSYKIINRDFELTVAVDRNSVSDDQYGIYAPMFEQLGASAADQPDDLVFGLLKAGFATACFDGQYFFDTDHPVVAAPGDGTTSASNFQGGSGEPWYLLDTSKPLKPLIFQERSPLSNLVRKDRQEDDNVFFGKEFIYGTDGRCNVGYGLWQLAYASKQPLTPANYEAARAAMASLKGDGGRPLNIKADTLVCSPALEGAAMRLLNNGTRVELVNNGTDDVPVAVQNEWAKTAEPIVTAWVA